MSLTFTAFQSRRIIKYGGVAIALFTFGYIFTGMAIRAYVAAHPPYVPPDVKFGLLPKTIFPDKPFQKKNFVAELPDDAFPKFKDQAKVYVIARPNSTFLALEQDTKSAKDMGFVTKPSELKYGVYQFKNNTLNLILTMNVLDGSFQLKYPYESDQMLLNPPIMPTNEEATSVAKQYLQNGGKFPLDLDEGNKKISYWRISFDGLKPVSSLSDANIIRIDFFRKPLEGGIKIVAPDIDSASVSVLVSGAQVEGKKIVEVNYKYANIDRELFSTYPIKTSEQAWADLKAGNYWPATEAEVDSITIRKIYLAYFEPVSLTNYLQPIFVFEGDRNFVAYVPAVTDKYIK